MDVDDSNEKRLTSAPASCPHCGTPLSPWEKILLSVDRALMCKHCWYRILLETPAAEEKNKKGRK